MNSRTRGRCGFSRTGTMHPAHEGAPTDPDSWSACPDLRKAIPQMIELIRCNIKVFFLNCHRLSIFLKMKE